MSQLEFSKDQFQEKTTLFAEVIVPVPIPKLFTYRVPFELSDQIIPGQRVVIQFGKKKVLTGVVNSIHDRPPKDYEAKYILDILETSPSLLPQQLTLIQWCTDYYMSTPGDVLSAALPSGLKLSSQSFLQLNPNTEIDDDLTSYEEIIVNNLQTNSILSYDEIAKLVDKKNIYSLIKGLVDKEVVLLIERINEKYQPKTISKIRLKEALFEDQDQLKEVFSELEKKTKQTDILLRYLSLVPITSPPDLNLSGIGKKELLGPDLSPSSLKTLVKNGILEEFSETVSRLSNDQVSPHQRITLSEKQDTVRQEILTQFEAHDVVLFHGITGSGKTEIYIKLIEEAIDNGGQVLYLLPEIALTTQIVKRLFKVFGNRLGIYHSKYSSNERVEVWQNLLNHEYDVVVGVRSSVFLPFSNLSLVIVDEEHEFSYKQFDQSPRYQARDVAVVLGQLSGGKVLLGSATPSFESYQNALNNKYGLVSLKDRYGEANLPDVEFANLLESRKQKTIRGEFSPRLLEEIKQTLSDNYQAIIFQNRRGYSPYLTCDECANVPKCQNCSVSLTYHMYNNLLRCHYCGYSEPAPKVCPSCGSHRLRTVGFGTEKLEEDLKLFFPDARIERMDLDTTRSKYGYQQLIDDFEKGNIDILVGTQMVTKGLDFDRVRLVGIVDLDRMLYFPDFRATERCFQLVTQVSGRAGRRKEKGKVIIQTSDPYQPVMQHFIQQDFVRFYQTEIRERSRYLYPPFHRLIKITFKNREQEKVMKASNVVAMSLRKELGERVLGPKEPIISKIRNQYLMEVLVKLEKSKINLQSVKSLVKDCVFNAISDRELKGTIVNFDVDPF